MPAPAASEPAAPEAKPAEDLPWWLSEAPRHAEPVRPPVLWQPAKIWTAHQQETEAEPLAGQASLSPEAAQTGAPVAETALTPMKAQESALEETSGNRASRLSGLRNLLFVLGVKDEQEGADAGERTEGGPGFEPRNGRGSQERTIEQILEAAPGIGRGTAARQVTAAPEFLPPKPVVIEFHKADSNLSDSSARQDRRASADGVEILPSKRGQYKKI